MEKTQTNYYGRLCTEMYELLHPTPSPEELAFYLSYAKQDMRILEPLCGSGRFLIPFAQKGFQIFGLDLSKEMLQKLKEKFPGAKAALADLLTYSPAEKFDYIFISCNSISLFTDISLCKRILYRLKALLAPKGRLVFGVDTVANRCPQDSAYLVSASVKTAAGHDLILKTKNSYDEESQTQFSPGIYELYHGKALLQTEFMDFQTHLYRPGEMKAYLKEAGFSGVTVYTNFQKETDLGSQSEMFLYECTL